MMGEASIESIDGKASRDRAHDEVTRRVGLYGELPYIASPTRTAAERGQAVVQGPANRAKDI